MFYSITFPEELYDSLTQHLFPDREIERAAYLLCSISRSANEQRLLVNRVIPVAQEDVESASPTDIVIMQRSYLRAIKMASEEERCFVFVHSHPVGYLEHSEQDDIEEPPLFRTAYNRIHSDNALHASLVISDPAKPRGRVWLEDGTNQPISRVRIMGDRFFLFDRNPRSNIDIVNFDRQILAFGEEVQKELGGITVGVVGLGGTGSAVVEQLTRLGVGKILICDKQDFEGTNVNRVFGSSVRDAGAPKTKIAKRNVDHIGLGTEVVELDELITNVETAQTLKECDVIFGCTDDESGRAILTKLAMNYLIPVFDMGVEVDADDVHGIKSVRGRVTTLVPHSPCVICRGIATGDGMRAEALYRASPDDYAHQLAEGYVPGLPGNAPSIVMFTSTIASAAITELLHRLTGFMGDRKSTEIIYRFDESKISTNSKSPDPECKCADAENWGVGDTEPFLELMWNN